MSLEYKNSDYKGAIAKLSDEMRTLSVGDLAELRRMSRRGAGCSSFWRLAVQSGISENLNKTESWMQIVKIMAILTPKGEQADRYTIHDSKKPFGRLLCDGGDPDWHGPLPLLSETKLMRFLAERNRRGDALERIARILATKRKSNDGVNCNTIAELILFPNGEITQREITRAYYQRLDHVSPETTTKEFS